MDDLQGNICMLKTILETCDDKMTEETKKRVQNLIDVFTKKLKENDMDVEYYYSVSEESDKEEEEEDEEEEDADEEALKQMKKEWEAKCNEEEEDDGYPEYDGADEV